MEDYPDTDFNRLVKHFNEVVVSEVGKERRRCIDILQHAIQLIIEGGEEQDESIKRTGVDKTQEDG